MTRSAMPVGQSRSRGLSALAGLTITLIVLSCGRPLSAEVPAWADERLVQRSGLVLWLDASRINAARGAAGSKDIASGGTVETWEDASGHQRNLQQSAESARPKLIKVGDARVVRFDGEDDHLRFQHQTPPLSNMTIFIVCAPHENPGTFRGLFAANSPGQRDYESGVAIDLGPEPTLWFDHLNVEGRGFGGARNLLKPASRFGTLHTLETTIDATARQVRLFVDGKASVNRPFEPADLSFEELTVGARFYTNGPGEQKARGYLKADIAELLVYDRVLAKEELAAVRAYLDARHAGLAENLPKELNLSNHGGVELIKAENPPPIQMLTAGFEVDELPLELTNVNSLRYRSDGKLVTLGYNGDIHLLSDTDGDGREDKADLFWKNEGSLRGPIGMLLTPENYAKGTGVFVPSKGKVSLIIDTNHDDRADEEIVVAQGWMEIRPNVDAVGIAADSEGNLYFGLGVGDYANAYQVGEDGKAKYRLDADNGTIQKVSADFSRRETVCTGIRFPLALAFNRQGDLFCTEQEGATWLPNGNPLDELLHIQPKRHYGFPPRHPRHNPGVIDEPSVFEYGPQHQSTCGMVFNESVNGGPTFGPANWAGDAIVCGESRGKLWRTKLMQTDSGYVAASQLLACLQMLTVDACVSPRGDLIVACHSGPPDWGTGPAGIGKLFRIRYVQPETPQPIHAWAEGRNEIRIAFDRPLDAQMLRNLTQQTRIEYGAYVRAGDRFENLVPPYAVVRNQLVQPRFELPVSSVNVTSDFRTLIFNTAAMHANAHYAVSVPMSADEPQNDRDRQRLDVDFALHGLQAEWTPTAGSALPAWTGWLPHPDLAVSKAMLTGSAAHETLWKALAEPGMLKMSTQLQLHHILRPAVQPGSKIDYEWPAEEVRLTLTSNLALQISSATEGVSIAQFGNDSGNDSGETRTVLTASGDSQTLVAVEFSVATGVGPEPRIGVSLSTNEDDRPRSFPLHRLILPWVRVEAATSQGDQPQKIAEIEGGSWARGRRLFRSEAAGCFKCHSIGGGGATMGPDLMNVTHRDYASVLRDLRNPSFAINPDFISHTVALHDGRVLTGVLQTERGELLLGDEKGVVTKLAKTDIETMLPSKTSIMPMGVVDKLSAEQLKDLMTYLLTLPPRMPVDCPLPAPPLRTQAEVAAVLAGAPAPDQPLRPLNIVLVAGRKDHGPGEHDYPAWQRVWEELLTAGVNVTVSVAQEFPGDEQLSTADTVLFFQKGAWDAGRASKMDAYFSRGGGAVYIHWAVNGNDEVKDFSKRIGYASWGGKIKYRHGPLTLDIHNTDHPIVRNFDQIQLYDESYWLLTGNPSDVTLLGTSTEEGTATPQMWVREHNNGRVFVSIPGHYSWTFDDPLFRVLLLRGIAWSAKEPVDRFNDLVPLGARMSR